MADLFTRVVHRALGRSRTARPARTPLFAPTHSSEVVQEARAEHPAVSGSAVAVISGQGAGKASPSQTAASIGRTIPPAESLAAQRAREEHVEATGAAGPARSGQTTDEPPPLQGPVSAEPTIRVRQDQGARVLRAPPPARQPLERRSSAADASRTDRVEGARPAERQGPVSQPRRRERPEPAVHASVAPRPAQAATAAEAPRGRNGSRPSIQVTIGRIEVRAVTPATAPPRRTERPARTPGLSLEAYLAERREGRR